MENRLLTYIIADDDASIVRVLELALKSKGYTCLGATANGLHAIELVREKKPQLILLDFHMPGLDGLTATKKITEIGTTAVVLFTGDSNPDLPRQAMDLGASGYLQKPFEVDHLVATMESAWHAFTTERHLTGTIRDLNDTLETRKLVEKAKGILMEQQHFTEEAAHKMLQKMSQDQGISLKEVCRSVIQVKMVLGKSAHRKIA